MRIAGCVVFYNGSEECLENIKSYLHILDKLFIVDNSDDGCAPDFQSLGGEKIQHIAFGENRGIAEALKVGVGKAADEGFDFCLTMDQDSVFPQVTRAEIEKRLNLPDIGDYGIIGLNFNSYGQGEGLTETDTWLTSGNFINLANYLKTDGFMAELFIDYVDFQLCEQFKKIGKKVAYYADLSLTHTIGNPIKKKFFGKSFTAMNHSPVRYYYRYRNARYLFKRNKKFYRHSYYHDLFLDTAKMLLFEKNRRCKLKMIKKGRRDAKRAKLGKYAD